MRPYKGYTATVEFDPDEMLLHGRVDNIRDVVAFHAESVSDLQNAFQEALDDYLDLCSERGEEPEKPYSGRFVVRFDPDLHRQAATAAERRRLSLNAWVIQAVQRALHGNRSSGDHPAHSLSLVPRTRSAAYRVPHVPHTESVDSAELRARDRLARTILGGAGETQNILTEEVFQ